MQGVFLGVLKNYAVLIANNHLDILLPGLGLHFCLQLCLVKVIM